jgi:hypothetical protein
MSIAWGVSTLWGVCRGDCAWGDSSREFEEGRTTMFSFRRRRAVLATPNPDCGILMIASWHRFVRTKRLRPRAALGT